MNSKNMTDFMKATIITAQQYGTKVSVELDHSDTSIDELFDAFQTICIGLGYHESIWKQWIIDRADEYNETDAEDLKEKLEAWKFDDGSNDIVLRHQYENSKELENDFFGQYDSEEVNWDDSYLDKMSKENRYRVTEEDESEFDDYGQRIVNDRPHFEWGDTPEEDSDLFEGDEWKPKQTLVEVNDRYKKEVKKMKAKQKRQK